MRLAQEIGIQLKMAVAIAHLLEVAPKRRAEQP